MFFSLKLNPDYSLVQANNPDYIHLVHRKRFELLAFGSVDRRYIQLS